MYVCVTIIIREEDKKLKGSGGHGRSWQGTGKDGNDAKTMLVCEFLNNKKIKLK